MAIVVTCSACNTRLTLGDDRAGDRFECPQCDAMIKVPGPAQPPARTPTATADATTTATATASAPSAKPPRPSRSRKREREPEDEPGSGIDKRVLGGIIGGGVGLLVVLVVIVVLASRKPAETVKQEPDPSAPSAATGGSLSGGGLFGNPSGGNFFGNQPGTAGTNGAPQGGTPVQPGVAGPAPLPQFQAQFLGAQGQGRRFCIIADNSGSMAGAKIANLRDQLLKTLTDLNPESEFYVIAFNSRPEPMPHHTWLKAGAPDAERVKTWVRTLPSRGGTQPAPAFETAFRLNPPPDLIFFMTDGQFANTVPARVVELNGIPRKSVVNTIMFAPGPLPKGAIAPPLGVGPEGVLKLIADQNGGTFTRYVP